MENKKIITKIVKQYQIYSSNDQLRSDASITQVFSFREFWAEARFVHKTWLEYLYKKKRQDRAQKANLGV